MSLDNQNLQQTYPQNTARDTTTTKLKQLKWCRATDY